MHVLYYQGGVRGKGEFCVRRGGIWCEEEGGGETEKILPNSKR